MKLAKLISKTALVTTALCLMGTLVNAAPPAQRGPISFDEYDLNRNGSVSKREFYDARARRVTQRANDGRAMRKSDKAPKFEQFDTNRNGRLSKVELLEGQNRQMQKRRADNNRAQRNSRQGVQQGKMNNQVNSARGAKRNMPMFDSFDLNGNGYITKKEMKQARSQRAMRNSQQGKAMINSANQIPFHKIDTNRDGRVSRTEFRAHQSRRR